MANLFHGHPTVYLTPSIREEWSKQSFVGQHGRDPSNGFDGKILEILKFYTASPLSYQDCCQKSYLQGIQVLASKLSSLLQEKHYQSYLSSLHIKLAPSPPPLQEEGARNPQPFYTWRAGKPCSPWLPMLCLVPGLNIDSTVREGRQPWHSSCKFMPKPS